MADGIRSLAFIGGLFVGLGAMLSMAWLGFPRLHWGFALFFLGLGLACTGFSVWMVSTVVSVRVRA